MSYPGDKVCAYPGCRNRLRPHNVTGRCIDHRYKPIEPESGPAYPNTRTVMMKEPTSTSYVFTEKPIRLPLEPWHDKV